MSSKINNVSEVLRKIEGLSIEDQAYISDILNKRLIDSKRIGIAKRAKETERAFKEGKTRKGTFETLWKDLND